MVAVVKPIYFKFKTKIPLCNSLFGQMSQKINASTRYSTLPYEDFTFSQLYITCVSKFGMNIDESLINYITWV